MHTPSKNTPNDTADIIEHDPQPRKRIVPEWYDSKRERQRAREIAAQNGWALVDAKSLPGFLWLSTYYLDIYLVPDKTTDKQLCEQLLTWRAYSRTGWHKALVIVAE